MNWILAGGILLFLFGFEGIWADAEAQITPPSSIIQKPGSKLKQKFEENLWMKFTEREAGIKLIERKKGFIWRWSKLGIVCGELLNEWMN